MSDARSLSGTPWRHGIFAILAVVMIATRSSLMRDHIAPLPDASWAVFFIAGFYLAQGRSLLRGLFAWPLAALLALAVLVDWYVISAQGIAFWSHYCVSPAYWFLLPAYASLWLGGAFLRSRCHGLHLRELGLLVVSALAAISACFLLSDTSYYWLSDSWMASGAVRSFGGWFTNFSDWYWIFTRTTLAYIGAAALIHVLASQLARTLPDGAATTQRQ